MDRVSVSALLPFSGQNQLLPVSLSARTAWETCAALKNPLRSPGIPFLDLNFYDVGGSQESTLNTSIIALNNATIQQDIVAMMGPLFSDLSIVASYVSNVYSLPLFDLASTSSITPDRFPFFVRGRLSTSTQAALWPPLLRLLGIRQVAIVSSDNVFGDFFASLALLLERSEIHVKYSYKVPAGLQPFASYEAVWANIRAQNIRV